MWPTTPTRLTSSAQLRCESLEARVAPTGFIVNNPYDGHDANPGDGQALTNMGVTTLRAAIEEGNMGAGGMITFGGPAFDTDQNITLTLGKLELKKDFNIVGLTETRVGLIPAYSFPIGEPANKWPLISVLPASTTTISRVDMMQAENTLGKGGAINNAGTLTLEDLTISGCTSSDGGAITSLKMLTLTRCTLKQNGTLAVTDGGALFVGGGAASTAMLFNTHIMDNFGKKGGGIATSQLSMLHVNGGSIKDNTADQLGGGIYNSAGNVRIRDSVLSNNAAARGGGLYNSNGGDAILDNVAVAGNSATVYGGAIYCMALSSIEIKGNTTFGVNTAVVGGPQIAYDGTLGTSTIITLTSYSGLDPDHDLFDVDGP